MSKKAVSAVNQQQTATGLGTAQAGTNLVASIKDLAAQSGVASDLTSKDRRQLSQEARFDRNLSEAVTASYEAHPEIAEPEFDVEAMRASLATIASYQPAVAALRTMLRALQDQMLKEKMSVATKSNALIDYLRAVSLTQRGSAVRADVTELNKLRSPKRRSPAKSVVTSPAPSPVDSATSK